MGERRKVKIVKGLFNFKPCLLRLSHLAYLAELAYMRNYAYINTILEILGMSQCCNASRLNNYIVV